MAIDRASGASNATSGAASTRSSTASGATSTAASGAESDFVPLADALDVVDCACRTVDMGGVNALVYTHDALCAP